ncbi:MAG: cell division protein ZapD [Betaproteobacteria bacterium]|nr:cell division protein ZapD [Betaproteobacteria bacterium]MCX7195116.1 cell division protein ZapD [Pseudomonadota bacterium]
MISYDFPLNERMRTLLRLEDLYAKLLCFIERSSATDHQAALGVLFEVLEVASRSDLKSELLQELERQKKQLSALHNNPEISEQALDSVLDEIESASSGVLLMSGKVGQHLRENEWLMGIKQRACIPGGTCEFDLPSYHHWLHQDAMLRRNYLMACLTPMLPIRDALAIILKLLRESGKAYHYIAQQGNFQQMPSGRVAQMLRISLDKSLPCVPEVGANKYMLNIRFIAADYVAKSALYNQPVAFNLTFCSL